MLAHITDRNLLSTRCGRNPGGAAVPFLSITKVYSEAVHDWTLFPELKRRLGGGPYGRELAVT